jgi:hypothetical protein
MRRKTFLTFTLLFCCSFTCEGLPERFFAISTDQQMVEFEKYDFDTQYDIYLCSHEREPHESEMIARHFARKGEAIVGPLEAKLNQADEDRTIKDIAYLFRQMSDQGTYAVVKDSPLMDNLRHQASSIRDSRLRVMTQDLLQEIRCETVPKRFFDMSTKQQMVEFEKYDFDMQYEIYICSQERVEPPELELATHFAKKGEAIVKPLEAKLDQADDDYTIRDIVYVFDQMSEEGSYAVAKDESLMDKIVHKISSMRDPKVRAMAEDSLQYIRLPMRERAGRSNRN